MIKVIISLTSYPKRIHTVHRVINSLFLQNEKADEIILWLSEVDFPKRNEELPLELLELDGKNGFHIRWVKDNLKSHKKYFYVLQEYSDSIVITVDDDMCYAKTMTSTLLASYKRHPHAVSARNVHRIFRKDLHITPYLTWEDREKIEVNKAEMDLCAIGVNGVLYPPNCSNEKWFNLKLIQKCAEDQDDLWLKYNEILDEIPVVYAGMEEQDVVIRETQESVLYIMNSNEGGNDNCIMKLEEQALKVERESFLKWLEQLMPIEDFLITKSEFYQTMLQRIFDDYAGKNIYICGAGKYAKILLQFIEKIKCLENIKALLVSEEKGAGPLENVMVQSVGQLKEEECFAVICGVGEKFRNEFKEILAKYELCDWIEFDIDGLVDYIRVLEMCSS